MKELSLCPQEDFEEVLELYNKMVYRLAYTRTGNYHDAKDNCRRCSSAMSNTTKALRTRNTVRRG